MRILHISTRLILGGSQENTVLSCEGQARLGHSVHLAYGPIYGPEGSLLERVRGFREGSGITTHEVPHLVREVRPFADRRALGELRRLIEGLRPDIVHTHSSKAGVLGRWAAWAVFRREPARRMGIVHTIHGPPFMPLDGPPPHRAGFRTMNAAYQWAERSAARHCHIIVSVAGAMTTQFLARGIGRPEQYITVYSGMEVERYLTPASGESRDEVRRALGLSPEDLVIGTVARLARHKGHDDLLDALAGDLKRHPNWKLLWVGDGWWRERLTARTRALGLVTVGPRGDQAPTRQAAAQIILTGLVPPERVPGLIRAMDILAHPSYREGLPRTVPQALLCGVCPVAYDVDGTGEVIRNGETGRLVASGDRTGLGAAVRELAVDGAARARMAANGREVCRERFSVEAMITGLENVYQLARERALYPNATRSA
ncbi:MAG: glycosyltransferase [Phycisphaerales bacterium]|nr:glycosyltransferase [Phycisphaerales bacterium]